ncbi:MAG: hypothetical protein IKK75_03455 [Clostridia bacterium]|nr:hypothetical protein [Clostridia bacterium]
MQYLFRRTRTRVHTADAEKMQRKKGWDAASRAMAAIQLGTQLLLWVFFYGYDLSAQAVWQAALMLILPLLLLWLVWRNASLNHPAARWVALPLVVCLLADAVLLVAVLGGFISQLVPNDPLWVSAIFPAFFCWLTALCARSRGVRYGMALLAVPLIVLLIISTVFLRASTRADRLWPILGDGLISTARCALSGAGALWGTALIFLLPSGGRAARAAAWAVVPWLLCVLCALWFGFLRPWAQGDDIAIAEKMMGLSRHAHSVILYEMSGILWMILAPASLVGCFSTAGDLLSRATPRLPSWAVLLPVPVLAVVVSMLWPESIFGILGMVLPWRWVLTFVSGLTLTIICRRTK